MAASTPVITSTSQSARGEQGEGEGKLVIIFIFLKTLLSPSSQDGVIRTGFSFSLQATTTTTTRHNMKQRFSRYWTSGNKRQRSMRDKKRMRWAWPLSQARGRMGNVEGGGLGVLGRDPGPSTAEEILRGEMPETCGGPPTPRSHGALLTACVWRSSPRPGAEPPGSRRREIL